MSTGPLAWPLLFGDPPERTLGVLLRDATILDELGELHEGATWPAIAGWCHDHHGLLLASHVGGYPWLPDAIEDATAQVGYLLASERVGAVRLRDQRGRTSWVVDSQDAWGVPPVPGSLAHVRSLWVAGGVGDHITAGAWGAAIAAAAWPGGELRVLNLASDLARLMRRTLVGGRSDTPDVGRVLASAMEYDLNSAYASEVTLLPGGTPYWYTGDGTAEAATGYWRCHWSLPTGAGEVLLSPLHAADAPTSGRRYRSRWYPTTGEHAGWYWSHEIQAARDVGIAVTVTRGWGWPALTKSMAPWLERMFALRQQVGALYAGAVKLATVATIGRWAAQPDAHTLRPAQEGDRILAPGIGIARVDAIRPGLAPHLTSYVMASSRLRVWRASLLAMAQGRYVASDYDSVLTTGEIQGLDLGTLPGQWKVASLAGPVRVIASRSIVSPAKVRLPGQTGLARALALAAAFDRDAHKVTCTICRQQGYASHSEWDSRGKGYHVCDRCLRRMRDAGSIDAVPVLTEYRRLALHALELAR